jgi:hypothetical protein
MKHEDTKPSSTADKADADSGRRRRPKPARTRPVRDASTLFKGGDPAAESAAGIADAVSQSVRLGYGVIKEQIERGRRTAWQFGGQNTQQEGAAGELNDIGRRILEFSSDFGALYIDLMEAMARLPSAAHRGHASSAQASSGTPGASGTSLEVEIDARRPSRVAIDLEPGAALAELAVRALLGADENAAPLTRISLDKGTEGGPLVLRVVVPDDQASGVYTGVVVDRSTNAPRGTLSVTLL